MTFTEKEPIISYVPPVLQVTGSQENLSNLKEKSSSYVQKTSLSTFKAHLKSNEKEYFLVLDPATNVS